MPTIEYDCTIDLDFWYIFSKKNINLKYIQSNELVVVVVLVVLLLQLSESVPLSESLPLRE